jgi:hypothetical protein
MHRFGWQSDLFVPHALLMRDFFLAAAPAAPGGASSMV